MVDVYDPNDATVSEEAALPKKAEINQGLKVFFAGIGIGLLVFVLSYLILSGFDIHYVAKAMLAFFIALLSLWALDSAMGDIKSRTKVPAIVILVIATIVTILIGYQKSLNQKPTKNIVKISSESGTINSVGAVWFTDEVFNPGTEVKIEISYHPVEMVGGRTLQPGVYKEKTIGRGKISFRGVTNAPTQIKVSY